MCVHVRMPTHARMSTHAHMSTHACMSTHPRMPTHARMSTHAHMPTHARMPVHARTPTHAHIHASTHPRTRTHSPISCNDSSHRVSCSLSMMELEVYITVPGHFPDSAPVCLSPDHNLGRRERCKRGSNKAKMMMTIIFEFYLYIRLLVLCYESDLDCLLLSCYEFSGFS